MPRRPVQLPGAGILVRMCGLGGWDQERKDRERGYSASRANDYIPCYWSDCQDSASGWGILTNRRIFPYDGPIRHFSHPFDYKYGDGRSEGSSLDSYESFARTDCERRGRRAPEDYVGSTISDDTYDRPPWQRRPRHEIRCPDYSLSCQHKSPDPRRRDLRPRRGSPPTQRCGLPLPPHTLHLNSPNRTDTALFHDHNRFFDGPHFPTDHTAGYPTSDTATPTSERGSYIRRAPHTSHAQHNGQFLDRPNQPVSAYGGVLYENNTARDDDARRSSSYDDDGNDGIDAEDDLDADCGNDSHGMTETSSARSRFSDWGARANAVDADDDEGW